MIRPRLTILSSTTRNPTSDRARRESSRRFGWWIGRCDVCNANPQVVFAYGAEARCCLRGGYLGRDGTARW
jgi:hypothetical protein